MNTSDVGATPRILVFGSLNLDHLWRVRRLPSPGETINCLSAARSFGGKGANQAVAAARAGGRVLLVGAVGDDADGHAYRAYLEATGIVTALTTAPGTATGSAHVYVDESAENLIVVHGGANDWWSAERVGVALAPVLRDTARLVLPAEAPLDAIVAAVCEAGRAGVPVLFNPSPCPHDFPWGVAPLDVVVTNRHEARELFELEGDIRDGAALSACRKRMGICRIARLVVTCGAEPTFWLTHTDAGHAPTHPVRPLDTVGAGDTFAGVLAVGLVEGLPFTEAIRRANLAGALSTLAKGAQTAMPDRATIDAAAR